MPVPSVFEKARKVYLPRKIKLLFLTEAPPLPERGRYFYFEEVRQGDSLFLELMKVLFGEEVMAFETVKSLRKEKKYFLDRLKEEGFYLTNATDQPLPDATATARIKTYRKQMPDLIKQLEEIITPSTPIVIVSAVVYEGCFELLREAGFNMLNEGKIEYPNSGQQLNFRRKLSQLLQKHGLLPERLRL